MGGSTGASKTREVLFRDEAAVLAVESGDRVGDRSLVIVVVRGLELRQPIARRLALGFHHAGDRLRKLSPAGKSARRAAACRRADKPRRSTASADSSRDTSRGAARTPDRRRSRRARARTRASQLPRMKSSRTRAALRCALPARRASRCAADRPVSRRGLRRAGARRRRPQASSRVPRCFAPCALSCDRRASARRPRS